MTEQDWLASTIPAAMLRHLDRPLTDRRLLLYAVACCRREWELLVRYESREAVEWVERFADGTAIRDETYARLEWASEGAAFGVERFADGGRRDERARRDDYHTRRRVRELVRSRPRAAGSDGPPLVVTAAYFANHIMCLDLIRPSDQTLSRGASLLCPHLIRDIFGNPFRPVAFDLEWRTSSVLALAAGMYDSRDFALMPILADALDDAGCDHPDILGHCRGPGPHVRGCWVVDLVLGKG